MRPNPAPARDSASTRERETDSRRAVCTNVRRACRRFSRRSTASERRATESGKGARSRGGQHKQGAMASPPARWRGWMMTPDARRHRKPEAERNRRARRDNNAARPRPPRAGTWTPSPRRRGLSGRSALHRAECTSGPCICSCHIPYPPSLPCFPRKARRHIATLSKPTPPGASISSQAEFPRMSRALPPQRSQPERSRRWLSELPLPCPASCPPACRPGLLPFCCFLPSPMSPRRPPDGRALWSCEPAAASHPQRTNAWQLPIFRALFDEAAWLNTSD